MTLSPRRAGAPSLLAMATTGLLLTGLLLTGACSLLAPTAPELADAKVTATYPLDGVVIGEVDGVDIRDGGYSSLAIAPGGATWVTTDRGPNLEAQARVGAAAKRFPIPDYTPAAERIAVDGDGIAVREQRRYLLPDGRAATGLPIPTRDPNIAVELAYGPDFAELGHDGFGMDAEGLTFDAAGDMWVSEEYRPSIWHFGGATGRLLERYTPTPVAPYDHPLPAWLLQRAPNLGIEGIAHVDGYVYAALQGPLQPPGGDRTTRITRILRLDTRSREVVSYAYALEGSTRKIGDLAIAPDGRLLVLEHGLIPGRGWSAEVYAIQRGRMAQLTDGGLPPERFRDPESALIGGVSIAPKTLYVDLLAAGWDPAWEKPEGLAVAADSTLLLVNDNDYGLVSPGADGRATATGVGTFLVEVR